MGRPDGSCFGCREVGRYCANLVVLLSELARTTPITFIGLLVSKLIKLGKHLYCLLPPQQAALRMAHVAISWYQSVLRCAKWR